MKIDVRYPNNTQGDLTVRIKSQSQIGDPDREGEASQTETLTEGETRSYEVGNEQYVEFDVDGVVIQLRATPSDLVGEATADASVTGAPADPAPGATITPDPEAPSGSPEEIASRTDATGAPAPVPSFSPGPAPADVEALEAAGIDPAKASPLSEVEDPVAPTSAPSSTTLVPNTDSLMPSAADDGPTTIDGGEGEDAVGEESTTAPEAPAETVSAGAGEDSVDSASDTTSGGEGNDVVETEKDTNLDTSEPREPTDEEIAAALKQAAEEHNMGDDIVDPIQVREVNAILKAKGLTPITAEKRTEVQKATISPNL